MAVTEKLSPEVLRGIAAQIGDFVPRARTLAAPGARPALGESLEVVVLTLNELRDGHGPLAKRVHANGQWHHQVYAGDIATDFARSRPSAPGADAPHRVMELVASPLPQALQRTMAWADENVEDDATAKVVEAPSFLLTGLWFSGPQGDSVVIAAKADRISNLPLNQRIDADDFLQRLAENEPVGLGLPRAQGMLETN